MDDAALHPARDDDDLAADVAGERVRGEDDDLSRHVLGLRDLAQRHRPRDAIDGVRVDEATGHRRLRPPGRDGVHPPERSDAHDLVLQGEKETAEDRGLRCGVVRVARLAEDSGRRADEDERPGSVPLHLSQKRPRDEEGRREVDAQSVLPPGERQLPHRYVLTRPDPLNLDADVDPAE